MNGIFRAAVRDDKATAAMRQRIAHAFARGAVTYDSHADLQRQVADCLLDRLPAINANQTVLDLGCGTGYCTQVLQQRAPATTVVALDLALPMLQLARTRCGDNSNLHCACADAQALPLQDCSVDLIVSSLTIQWCSDLSSLFAEMRRVLRPGGRVLLSTLGPHTLQELRAAWSQVDATQHGNQFTSQQALLLAAEAANLNVNITTEFRVRYYESLRALARELKGLGANAVTASTSAVIASPTTFKAAAAAFASKRESSGIPVSWEIFYLHLQKAE